MAHTSIALELDTGPTKLFRGWDDVEAEFLEEIDTLHAI